MKALPASKRPAFSTLIFAICGLVDILRVNSTIAGHRSGALSQIDRLPIGSRSLATSNPEM
jgi:hypothetical protein